MKPPGGNGADERDVQAKIREGRRAFLRLEAGRISRELARFVDHADDLGAPLSRGGFDAIRRAYQILADYEKGTL